MLALASIVFALPSSPQGATTEQQTTWSVRPPSGVRIEYVLNSEWTTEFEDSNDRFVTTTKSEQGLAIELVAINEDGSTTLACHFGSAKGTVKFDGSVMAFDSAKGVDEAKKYHAEHSGRTMLRAGKSVRVVIDAQGAVKKVDGLARLYAGSKVEEDLAGKEKTLEDSDFVEEAQSWIALLPEVVPTRGARWTESVPIRTHGDTRIEFQPEARVNSISDAEIRWTFKTAVMGSASSKSKALPIEKHNGVTTIELKARSGREWISRSPLVSAAAIEGSTTVARGDGLPVQRTLDWQAELDFSDMGLPTPRTKMRERMRIELIRR